MLGPAGVAHRGQMIECRGLAVDEAVGNGGNRKQRGGRGGERKGSFGRAEKAAETCLFASDVVNADSP